MTCSKCHTFFCWLCLVELSRSNPYAHYQHPTSPCANLLFEGIELFDGANDIPDMMDDDVPWLDDPDIDEDDNDDDDGVVFLALWCDIVIQRSK